MYSELVIHEKQNCVLRFYLPMGSFFFNHTCILVMTNQNRILKRDVLFTI